MTKIVTFVRTITTVALLTFLCMFVAEVTALSILYVNDRSKGILETFFADHLLTTFLFPTAQPIPGKTYVGTLVSGGWARWFAPDPILGFRMYPNTAARHGNYLYITDQNGFIEELSSPYVIQQNHLNSSYRIAVLGGSTVMGQGAPDPSQNLVGKLRRIIGSKGLTGPEGQSLEVLNAGVGGYQSGQELLYLLEIILNYKPDLVVIYDGWNDSIYNNFNIFRHGYKSLMAESHFEAERRLIYSYTVSGSLRHALQNVPNALTPSFGSGAKDQYFGLGTIELADRFLKNFFLNSDNTVHPAPTEDVNFDPRSVQLYENNLRDMISVTRGRGIPIALFLQPLLGDDGKEPVGDEISILRYPSTVSDMKLRIPFYQQAREVFAKLQNKFNEDTGVCLADLSRSFRDMNGEFYVDSGHLNPNGNAIISEKLLNHLINCRFIK